MGEPRVWDVDRVMQHIDAPTGAATAGHGKNLENAWRLFLELCPEAGGAWPPPLRTWVGFLLATRDRCSSHKAMKVLVGLVDRYGKRQFNVADGAMKTYANEHGREMRMLQREDNGGVNQVAGVTQEEVNNFHKFVDTSCYRGLCKGALFAFGVMAGGRRARTVTSIMCGDVTVTCNRVKLRPSDTSYVYAPSISVLAVECPQL